MNMTLTKYRLQDIAEVEISGVDKKILDGETAIRLCNFTDVYYNWAITQEVAKSFLVASANTREINKFRLRKGMVALTKDSETRFDIGISAYIADDLEGVILGYHCALVTPLESIANGKYLNAFINSSYIKQYCANGASGSGQRYSLPISVLKNMPILLPSIKEQQAIGDLLSQIDRKITLNRAINHNLPIPDRSSEGAEVRLAV